jgi:hypothetical protein
MFGGGLMVALAIILARASSHYSFTLKKRSEEDLKKETHTFGDAVEEQNRPVPVFIWLVAIGYIIWAISYVVFSGTRGL